ncbi:hypothetical protein [Leucobacter sp. NPDC077196]|uniref:hypothetical protein n=1 Tax=Leucobacter sp. NPDC077196 TaxID=3154959 RepID=UPI00342C7C50
MSAARNPRAPRGALPFDEFVAELEWLLSFGTHPHLVARQMKLRPASVQKRLNENGRTDLAERFGRTIEASSAA